ncbi:hypothetical protein MTQ01_21945 [Streptomyces sp. XM4193]|uniref:hypothetical protein n=1 Tax=Streptomyces sp. XM4193 TaxID=2929782 RepID=UPI001FFB279A|nr:hypothetical protein [Streptomyces sp. XM4193]MCK1798638.1 hypothetical protein [Streptomyces sp. XM4193]
MDESTSSRLTKPFAKAGWYAPFGTQEIAQAQVKYVHRETGDAVVVAKAYRTIIRDCHSELSKLKKQLHTLADEDAREAGLFVTSKGKVIPRRDLADRDVQQDPESEKAQQEQQRKIKDFEGRIKKILRNAEYADSAAATALRRAAGNNDHDFNAKAPKSVNHDEALRASKLLDKMEDGGTLTKKESAELDRIMEHNQRDGDFSRKLLRHLGPKRTLDLADDLDTSRYNSDASAQDRKQARDLERYFANSVGAANEDKEFSEKWREQMQEHGVRDVDAKGKQTNGYQTLSTLLSRGTDAYPPHMTTGLTDDMIKAEKKDPELWDRSEIRRYGDVRGAKVVDPVDNMLTVMSRDPTTATEYLDPDPSDNATYRDPDSKNDNLAYLMKEREWPSIDLKEESIKGGRFNERESEPTNSRVGLGHLIESATTGDKPGSPIDREPHTPAQARVMTDTINMLDKGVQDEDVHENLRKPVAASLADFAGDTSKSLNGSDSRYGDNDAGYFVENEEGKIAPDRGSLIRVMRGVSEDPESYAVMHQAQIAQNADDMAAAGNDQAAARVVAAEGAGALGAYDAIREDIITDKNDDAQTDWKAKTAYHVFGGAANFIPVGGDIAQRMIDTAVWDMGESVKGETSKAALAKIAEEDLASEEQSRKVVDSWAGQNGRDPNSTEMREMKMLALQQRGRRREAAERQLGNE